MYSHLAFRLRLAINNPATALRLLILALLLAFVLGFAVRANAQTNLSPAVV